MNKKKHWYDYLWIVTPIYLGLGFFNILFAWLGMLFFCLPLLIAIFGGSKLYCNRYCDRGQFLGLLGGRLKLSRNKPTPRCVFCPMGTMTQLICRLRAGKPEQAACGSSCSSCGGCGK